MVLHTSLDRPFEETVMIRDTWQHRRKEKSCLFLCSPFSFQFYKALALKLNWRFVARSWCAKMANDAMIVTNTPGRDLVSTNFAYCSLVDRRRLATPGSRLVFACVGDTWVLSIGYPFLGQFRILCFVFASFISKCMNFVGCVFWLSLLFHRKFGVPCWMLRLVSIQVLMLEKFWHVSTYV